MGTVTLNTKDVTRALLSIPDSVDYHIEWEPDRSYTVLFEEKRHIFILSISALEYGRIIKQYQLDPSQCTQLYVSHQLRGHGPANARVIIDPNIQWTDPAYHAIKCMLEEQGFKHLYERGLIRG